MNILAIGAHPDDVEIGCGGTLARLSEEGNHCTIIDVTTGDMGTNGNSEVRIMESIKAAGIMKVDNRIQLGLSDRRFGVNIETIEMLAEHIRDVQPDIIFIPYGKDRHPDHNRAHDLCIEAIFDARCRKLSNKANHWSTPLTYEYYINTIGNPLFYFDISDFAGTKNDALLAHRSQFVYEEPWEHTRLNDGFVDMIMSRDRNFGTMLDTKYAEAFETKQGLLLNDLRCHKRLLVK